MAETAKPDTIQSADNHEAEGETRRDFLVLTAGAMGVVGAASAGWVFIDAMNPAADTLALATTEVNLGSVEVGQAITVTWRGKPVFIRRRTAEEIEAARNVELSALPDPQSDEERVIDPQWLIMVGVCTHLGCVPLGQGPADQKGNFGGWFCPCHGSHYDTSGRIRLGPAPTNLEVPEYEFLDEENTRVRLG